MRRCSAVNHELIALVLGHRPHDRGASTGPRLGQGCSAALAADPQVLSFRVGGYSASNLWRMKVFFSPTAL